MDVHDLLARLQGYGLDEGEAQLYYHLCRLGPSRAAGVAEAAGRKRTDAYRLLDRLVDKGFADRTLERPARYLPREPEIALARALEVRRRETDALDAQRETLVAAWPRPVAESAPNRQRFAVHQGRAQVNSLLLRMVESATDEILVATSVDGLGRLDAAAMRHALEARAAQGAMVRVLAKRGRDGTLPLADLKGAGVRFTELPTFYQAIIVDAREIAFFVAAGKGISGAEETVLWLSSSDMVVAQKALFDQAWAQALSKQDLDLDPPPQVQVLRGRWVRSAKLKEMIAGARKSVAIEAPAAEAQRWARIGIAAALEHKAKEGVAVTLRTDRDAPRVAGATHLPPHRASGAVLALVDGKQVLMAFPQGESDALHDESEWAVWSTLPDLVRCAQAGGPLEGLTARVVRPTGTTEP